MVKGLVDQVYSVVDAIARQVVDSGNELCNAQCPHTCGSIGAFTLCLPDTAENDALLIMTTQK